MGFFEASQLALATLGDLSDGTLPVFTIRIAPSPAVATSASMSSLANPVTCPLVTVDELDLVDVKKEMDLVCLADESAPVTSAFLGCASTPVYSHA